MCVIVRSRCTQWRYTEWVRFNDSTATPNWTDVWGQELYNHGQQTVNFNDENVNMAYSKGTEGIIAELKKMLISGWRGALPDATIQV